MIYHLSLQTVGLLAGLFLLLVSLPGVFNPDYSRGLAKRLPRSRVAGFLILTIDLFWTLWLLATVEMGEFQNFRRPLLIVLPIGFFLVLRFVDEFLAVRALGMLFLLAAEPLLDAAFFRNEPSRLLVTVLAYLMIVIGLFWVTMPYLMRDHIEWSARTNGRWRLAHSLVMIYGITILACAVTQY